MKRSSNFRSEKSRKKINSRTKNVRRQKSDSRPVAAYGKRGVSTDRSQTFYATEDWHEPTGSEGTRYIVQEPGAGYFHPVSIDEIHDRLVELPDQFSLSVEVVQLSRMTRKRALFPCYGMQWGPNVYLYPIEESLVEIYVRPPTPQQLIEAKMFGGKWTQDGNIWQLAWTEKTIKDFYLNNVLIHEVGHVNDDRNTNFDARERYANWFAIEYGYRTTR